MSKKITSVGFRCIFKSLRFPHLKILNLNFFECNGITKPELSRLYKALTKFPRIKVLALSFERCWKRYFDNGLDNGLLHLGETLQKLRTLRNLNLNFGDCSLKDQVLCNIGRNIQKLRLQDFALNLNDCSSLTYQEQKMFCEDLAKMKSLQGLNLSLQSINGANFIYLLAHAIKNLVYLRNLKLNFDWQKSLQGHFYLQIKEILQVLPYLQSVNFSFRANDWITDNVLKDLSEGFRDAVSLKSVKLNFRMCKRITLVSLGDKSGLEDLSQTLRNMPGLEYIEIDLSVCGLSKKAQDEFKRPFDALKRCRTNIIFRHKVDD